jgi:hypothetical protein
MKGAGNALGKGGRMVLGVGDLGDGHCPSAKGNFGVQMGVLWVAIWMR